MGASVIEVFCPKKIPSKRKSFKGGSSKEPMPVLNSHPLSNADPLSSMHLLKSSVRCPKHQHWQPHPTPPHLLDHPLSTPWNSAWWWGPVLTRLSSAQSWAPERQEKWTLLLWQKANTGAPIAVQSPQTWKLCLLLTLQAGLSDLEKTLKYIWILDNQQMIFQYKYIPYLGHIKKIFPVDLKLMSS